VPFPIIAVLATASAALDEAVEVIELSNCTRAAIGTVDGALGVDGVLSVYFNPQL
jgi:hypothetical protein